MRKEVTVMLFVSIFMLHAVASVYATVSVEGTIEEDISVVYSVSGLDQTVYDEAKTSQIFNGSNIVSIIVANLTAQGRIDVTHGFQLNTYDDANKGIRASFFLGGTDIITSAVNNTSLKRNFQVETDWRKFQVNLTSSISIDFATLFAESVENWQQIEFTDSSGNVHPSYYYETGETAQLGKMSFRFVLSSAASNAQAVGDTITYDISLGFEDILISSPFPILAIIIVVVLIALVYRRLR